MLKNPDYNYLTQVSSIVVHLHNNRDYLKILVISKISKATKVPNPTVIFVNSGQFLIITDLDIS